MLRAVAGIEKKRSVLQVGGWVLPGSASICPLGAAAACAYACGCLPLGCLPACLPAQQRFPSQPEPVAGWATPGQRCPRCAVLRPRCAVLRLLLLQGEEKSVVARHEVGHALVSTGEGQGWHPIEQPRNAWYT